jgi:D-tyrosyl-tRNA(Tyr) deacylase
MRAVLQRVSRASVTVKGEVTGSTGRGLLVLVAVEKGDALPEMEWLARKVAEVRIFPDAQGRMNLSVEDVGGGVLAVSQFTLAARMRKGRRPSFSSAEGPERASDLFDGFVEILEGRGIPVETGRFGAMMEVELVNDGPVTIILERGGAGESGGEA